MIARCWQLNALIMVWVDANLIIPSIVWEQAIRTGT